MENVSPVAVDISGIDIRAGGVTFRAGEPVLMNFAAPGRDPVIQGASAGRFDVQRARQEGGNRDA
jgi:cytochrome P450